MGARGPKPRPTHLKVLQGEQESRINRDEPMPSEGKAVRPHGMTAGGAEIWDQLAPDLMDKTCLTTWDVCAFEMYCETVAQWRQCRDLLHERNSGHGKFIEMGAAKGLIKSPYHQMMRDCEATASRIGSRFGFTPGDRANLAIGSGDDGVKHGAERILA